MQTTCQNRKAYMKHVLYLLMLLASLSATAQEKAFFELPIIPDKLQTLQERTDYMVEHYWDFCDLKKSFSSRAKMAEAFDTYLSFMPYASADVAFKSVTAFLNKISKQPADVLFIGELAEGMLYSDTAEFKSDELYLHFAKLIAENKKIDKTSRLRYQHQAKVLSQSQVGMKVTEFDYIDPTGSKQHFAIDTTQVATVIFFNDPDCSDCNMARIRLDADIKTNRLIDTGRISIYSIYPGDPGNEWMSQVSVYPATWKIGAAPDADEIFDIRQTPMFYIMDHEGKIVLKDNNIDLIINIMSLLHAPKKKRAEATQTSGAEPQD